MAVWTMGSRTARSGADAWLSPGTAPLAGSQASTIASRIPRERTGLARKETMQRIYNTPSDVAQQTERSAICVPGAGGLATDGARFGLHLEREAINQPY